MVEFDRSHERQWYRVEIDWIAAFIVRSYTEEGAMHKVDLYCQSQPWLGLNVEPEGGLSLSPETVKPLDPYEENYYDILGDDGTPVRLIEDKRKLVSEPKVNSGNNARSQQRLFDV